MRLLIITLLAFGFVGTAKATPTLFELAPLRNALDFRIDTNARPITNTSMSNERVEKSLTVGSYQNGHGGTRRVAEEPKLGATFRLEHHTDMDGAGSSVARTYLHLGPIKIPLGP